MWSGALFLIIYREINWCLQGGIKIWLKKLASALMGNPLSDLNVDVKL